MKMLLTALTFALVAPAAFAQTTPPVHHKKAKPGMVSQEQSDALKTLRAEIKRDKNEMAARTKDERAKRRELASQEKAEIAKVKGHPGTRAEKKKERQAIHEKYAKLIADLRHKNGFERKQLLEDMTSKRSQIKKSRQS